MSSGYRAYSVPTGSDLESTIENAIDAVDNDPDLPDVDRGRGRPRDGAVSRGQALAIVAEAYTGWSGGDGA